MSPEGITPIIDDSESSSDIENPQDVAHRKEVEFNAQVSKFKPFERAYISDFQVFRLIMTPRCCYTWYQ